MLNRGDCHALLQSARKDSWMYGSLPFFDHAYFFVVLGMTSAKG